MAIPIEHNGEVLTLSGWARKLGVREDTFHDRKKDGWTYEEILTTPLRTTKLITLKGEVLSLRGWSLKTGLDPRTIGRRVADGWPEDKILSPVVKPFCKWEAEKILDDTNLIKLPKKFRLLIEQRQAKPGPGCQKFGKKYGEIIRNNYRDLFNDWFSKKYR